MPRVATAPGQHFQQLVVGQALALVLVALVHPQVASSPHMVVLVGQVALAPHPGTLVSDPQQGLAQGLASHQEA